MLSDDVDVYFARERHVSTDIKNIYIYSSLRIHTVSISISDGSGHLILSYTLSFNFCTSISQWWGVSISDIQESCCILWRDPDLLTYSLVSFTSISWTRHDTVRRLTMISWLLLWIVSLGLILIVFSHWLYWQTGDLSNHSNTLWTTRISYACRNI